MTAKIPNLIIKVARGPFVVSRLTCPRPEQGEQTETDGQIDSSEHD